MKAWVVLEEVQINRDAQVMLSPDWTEGNDKRFREVKGWVQDRLFPDGQPNLGAPVEDGGLPFCRSLSPWMVSGAYYSEGASVFIVDAPDETAARERAALLASRGEDPDMEAQDERQAALRGVFEGRDLRPAPRDRPGHP